MTERDIAVQLAVQEVGVPPADVTDEQLQPIQLDLHHRCLPKLEAAEWIERTPEGIVVIDSSPVAEADSPPTLLTSDGPPGDVIDAFLARPLRQDLASIVADRHRPLTLEELATELTSRERVSSTTGCDEDELPLSRRLHHVDLPRLADVGLLEYDPDEKTVARTHLLMALLNPTNSGNGGTSGANSD